MIFYVHLFCLLPIIMVRTFISGLFKTFFYTVCSSMKVVAKIQTKVAMLNLLLDKIFCIKQYFSHFKSQSIHNGKCRAYY